VEAAGIEPAQDFNRAHVSDVCVKMAYL
jgi:hypothetical protein